MTVGVTKRGGSIGAAQAMSHSAQAHDLLAPVPAATSLTTNVVPDVSRLWAA